MKITILPNFPYGDTIKLTNEIIALLSAKGVTLFLPEGTENYLSAVDTVHFKDYESSIAECDIIIAVGGDGTVTKYASDAAVHGKPILGINGGHLGFLSGLEKSEISLLSNLLSGDYKIKQRMMLYAQVFDPHGKCLCAEYCVNDAVIGRAGSTKMVDVNIELDGKHLSRHLADGVIVATPTGSTAYSMSAGGPVVDPHTECMIVTPICSHSLTARSVVCSSESLLKLTNGSDSNSIRQMCLTTDSREPVEVPYGGWVEIKKAEIPVSFITIKRQSFYEILREKMLERNNA